MVSANYVYYAVIDPPKHPAHKPLGLFRAPGGDMWEIEALRRDGRWHYSSNQLVKHIKGEFDGEEIDLETAAAAYKNLKGRE